MTLYLVQAMGRDDAALAEARFIPDGFSRWAFLLGQVWLLYHRLWLALAVWVSLEVAFILVVLPHVSSVAAMGIDTLAHLFVGFEGNRLRQAKAETRAVVTDLVEARTRDEAEAIFYGRVRPANEADA